jgi:hypothetical protein
MTTFSLFFKDSGAGGLVTSCGLGLSFSETGFAAKRNPKLNNRMAEMIEQMKIAFLNFDLMIPPENGEKISLHLIKIKNKFNFKDFLTMEECDFFNTIEV